MFESLPTSSFTLSLIHKSANTCSSARSISHFCRDRFPPLNATKERLSLRSGKIHFAFVMRASSHEPNATPSELHENVREHAMMEDSEKIQKGDGEEKASGSDILNGGDVNPSKTELGLQDWEFGKQEKLIMVVLMILSMVVALDAAIVAPVLPVRLVSLCSKRISLIDLDHSQGLEWICNRCILGRNLIPSNLRCLSAIYRSNFGYLRAAVVAPIICRPLYHRDIVSLPCTDLSGASRRTFYSGDWRRRCHILSSGHNYRYRAPSTATQVWKPGSASLGTWRYHRPFDWRLICTACNMALDILYQLSFLRHWFGIHSICCQAQNQAILHQDQIQIVGLARRSTLRRRHHKFFDGCKLGRSPISLGQLPNFASAPAWTMWNLSHCGLGTLGRSPAISSIELVCN